MYETPDHLVHRQNQDLPKVPTLGLGFTKVALDSELHARLLDHFRSNVRNFRSEPANPYLLTENIRAHPSLIYQDANFNDRLAEDLRAVHQKWSGVQLKTAACYGIRVYQPGSYLYNHLDQISTHVVSSTICIDHRLNNPWPLYIEDLEGNPHEVSVEAGEMVFYEGARLTHGRPYPLDGEYYANIFVHYTPIDWELKNPRGEGDPS